MGGLGGDDSGHLNHLYEDYNLTFGELKSTLASVINSEITLYEKVDGQNLSLTHDPRSHASYAARNKTDIKARGIDKKQLNKRYSDKSKERVREAFTDALVAFNEAVTDLVYYQRFQTFDSDQGGVPFVNLEVMAVDNPNVIKYDRNYLVMHGVTRYKSGTAQGRSCKSTFQEITKLINGSIVKSPDSGKVWFIKGPTEIDLSRTLNKGLMKKALKDLAVFMKENHLEDDDTISDYLENQIVVDHLKPFSMTSEVESAFLNRMLDVPGALPTPSIVKGMNPIMRSALSDLARDRRRIVRNAIMPLELIINKFGIGLLENSHSVFVDDGPGQVKELRARVKLAVKRLFKDGNDRTKRVLKMNYDKLDNDVKMITSTVEGVVFSSPLTGKSYKITGAFAPVNQILGLDNPAFAKSRAVEKPLATPLYVA